MKNLPIIIVDEDTDDQEFLTEAWNLLNYPYDLVFLSTGDRLITYLNSDDPTPFLILCDINVPPIGGFKLKEKITTNKAVKYKSIPFIYWSTSVFQAQIKEAYDLGGHGFFRKPASLEEIKKSLVHIVEYWQHSLTPKDLN